MATLNIQFHEELKKFEDATGRHYILPDGSFADSVTTVLASHGAKGLASWRKSVGEKEANRISFQASDFGTQLHNLAEQYIKGEPLKKDNPFALARFRVLVPTIDKRISDVWGLETTLYYYKLKLAGRTDVIGVFDSVASVIDFKTSRKPKKPEWIESYFLQTALYNYMWAEMTKRRDILPVQLVILISVEGESYPQIFIEPTSKWIPKALAWVKTYHESSK